MFPIPKAAYRRSYPRFSLCGLNCGLCPRYHTNGSSRCPGCGGEGFYEKHPSCSIINCAHRHGGMEYCFQCGEYPCARYQKPFEKDSFLSYRNVLEDMERAREGGVAAYGEVLDGKTVLLEYLLEHCNDGRKKGFFCNAVNLLSLEDVRGVVAQLKGLPGDLTAKERGAQAVALLEGCAAERGVSLALRK